MRSATSNFDRLFESLPNIEPISRPPSTLPRSFFPMLRWPLNRPYLGFTPVDRRREHQVQVWLTKGGFIPPPGRCSICGTVHKVAYHGENYYDLWRTPAVCAACHRVLHLRHRAPSAWLSLVERHSQTGEEWFRLTPLDPLADFAGYLRKRFGPDYTMLNRAMNRLPEWIAAELPITGLMPLGFVAPTVQPVARDGQRWA